MIITENQLDEWVRGNARDAQGVIVELVWRLVAASCPRPKDRRFPLSDSIGQHGPDGLLEVDLGFDPFVPDGRSVWEIGTGLRAGDKATSDYNDLVAAIPANTRLQTTFVFVTPLSGRRDWEHTWKEDAQATWLELRRAKRDWLDVRVIDGTRLIDWMRQFPSVELWLAQRTIGVTGHQVETLEQRWSLVREIGAPPTLSTGVFLTNRDDAKAKIKEVFARTTIQLKLQTHFPGHVVDFVSACLADLGDENRADAAGRCLVISGVDAWNAMVVQKEQHVLIADTTLDLSGDAGTKLIQKARRAGHAVIFGGTAGGIPDPTSVALPAPRTHHIQDALEKCGYSAERARTLAQKSGGNIGSLLRCLQNLSVLPEWASGTPAAELAIATALGSWVEESDADRAAVEGISGKAYGEWIGKLREVALRPGTPLIQRNGNWRFLARFEGWYALGPNLFDDTVDRLRIGAVSVLTENDPQFELPKGDRYASSIYGKVLAHSSLLRSGLAEMLALLGSHPAALTSCTHGKAEVTAALAVRAILSSADWRRWAGLNDLLPLLAEAAPREFLDAVEKALGTDPCPFDEVFAQEGDGFMGHNYLSGLLWSLETLAWDPDHLGRVVMCLGELATHDPGGRWNNRPVNSLTTILLPWMPQTCAPIAKRGVAVSTLLAQFPEIGWKLLIGLLPKSHSSSFGTRKPAWRETIPADWPKGTTQSEYQQQIQLYTQMAVSAATSDRGRLVELIDHIEDLPEQGREQILAYVGSSTVLTISEADRLPLWTALIDLVTKHRKFSDAVWAMGPAQVDKIADVADQLAPKSPLFRYQRLFKEQEFDLYEQKDNYKEQSAALEVLRRQAVDEVFANGGAQAVVAFASAVQSPWRVGIAFGDVAAAEADGAMLPALLQTEREESVQFVGGFVWSRFRILGWTWVDGFHVSSWTPAQIGQFLAFLPFALGTWERSKRLLGTDEAEYWSRTSVHPYETDIELTHAIDQLIQCGRPNAALRCINRQVHQNQAFDPTRAARALLAAVTSGEKGDSFDAHQAVDIIKALQDDPATRSEDLFQVEWAYLRLLDRHSQTGPRFLARRLATEPTFFCEVIRLVFRSKNEERAPEAPSVNEASVAANAYHLLSEWRTPPGYKLDGSYDGDALFEWLEAVKTQCAETGHVEIAMTMVGHSLTHAPPDPDGLWIHRAAAEALNAADASDMRNGFRVELANSRGAYYVDPTGKPERELAQKYRGQAESVENAGYHRLATSLRELAISYDREAERVVSSARDEE